jgi:hypothetical protein
MKSLVPAALGLALTILVLALTSVQLSALETQVVTPAPQGEVIKVSRCTVWISYCLRRW